MSPGPVRPADCGAGRLVANDRQRVSDQAFNAAQIVAFSHVAERNGRPAGAGARRPSDAVDVVLGLVGKLIVDDVADACDVKATSRDVGGHQNPRVAVTEPLQRALAGALGLVAVDGLCGDTASVKLLGHAVGAVFGAREHEDARKRRIVQNAGEQGGLGAGFNMVEALLDALDRGCLGEMATRTGLARISPERPATSPGMVAENMID